MESKRVNETKERIKTAFLELYAKKTIDKITIKEITEKAQINRGTFYVYYMDIYDLLEKIEDEVVALFEERIETVILTLLRGNKLDSDVLPEAFFRENPEMISLVFGERAEPRMINKIKEIAKRIAIHELQLNVQGDTIEAKKTRYILEYISAAQVGLVTAWFRNHMDMPMDFLGELIVGLNFKGALTCLKELE
ncbi:TetR/AcrR family transcriptional regulator [Anaerovorax sp. IOR16]|uniref:TetR/AcrR family transcriptional regulator n=1 Tax=Anaerovorax sp. IOR16 TaxID=2773458 RepID=UPI0019D16434|nr:TetR/AcrR family transcriptional regulator [Anaerovorax sp. IOR16]